VSTLNASQTDALTELINIAFGLTAAKLSEISGERVLLEAPVISIHPVDDLAKELGSFVTGEVASIHQVFTGPFSGDALLLLNLDGAVRLGNLLIDEHLRSERLDSGNGEVLTEVGNMLLSACLGVFGNLLEMRVSFSVPLLHLDSLKSLLASITIGGDGLRHAVVIATSFRIHKEDIAGQLAIALAPSSLEQLIQAVEVWDKRQFSA
jgi:chemotaxis protein CheC